MSIEVKVPQLPESVTDATLVSWHKAVGDAVSRDENLVDLETDKVVLEVPAPVSGTLKEIRIEDGTTVTSGEVLAVLEEGEAAPAEPPTTAAPEATAAAAAGTANAVAAQSSDTRLSPAVRRLLEQHDVDPSRIKGSGRDGRLTKSDVMDFIAGKQETTAEPAPAPGTRGLGWSWRAACADDPIAIPHSGTDGRGPGDRRHADFVQ
jgi:2-oxoglutarate dehydrogenase E2 component (dihydrolipoamide succinyltransferase)